MLAEAPTIPSSISELVNVFRGPQASPFLAPRGVWTANNKLVVSDTGQNRVFIWNSIPTGEFEDPDVVLGQEETARTDRNQGGQVSASSLLYPSGIWTDGHKLFVADAWNHRVLLWLEFPKRHGQPADVVLGQRDFTTNLPNADGMTAIPNNSTLYWPYGLHSDGTSLWIADTGNRRVLYFEKIPEQHFQGADAVIGKTDFSIRDYEPDEPIWPYSVRVGEQGKLAITDTQFFRVLIWDDWKKATGSTAPDQIIGQEALSHNGQNQFLLSPNAKTLNWCYDSHFYKDGIFVVDTANSRLKWHPHLQTENNPAATDLIGQGDFHTGSENEMNLNGTHTGLYWPFAVCIDDQMMAIADTGNHRIIIKKLMI